MSAFTYMVSYRNSSTGCTTLGELVDRSQNLWKWTPRCLAKLLQDPRNRGARWANTPQGLVNMITLFKTGRGQIFPMPLRISNLPTALYCSKFALDCCRLSLSEWTIITFNRITWSGCDNLGWTIPAVWLWPFVLFVVYYSITLPICKWAPLPNCSK